ncbi:MAG: response regulator [Oscillibacter sp.]|nr:response regulator [Oscillibacter sp.]
MSAKLKAWITDRRILRLALTLALMILLLSCLGVLLYLRVNALLNRYMEVQGEKQAETLAELTQRQFEVELTALYTVASELPRIEGMRANALQAIQEADYDGRIGVQRIDGSPFYGEAYSMEDFPCIESATHGKNAVSYCPGKGLMFCVPALREENVAFVVYRLYPEAILYQRFGVVSYGGSGHVRIEDAENHVVVPCHPADAESVVFAEDAVFAENSVVEGVQWMERTLYGVGSASVFRRCSLGETMLYAAVIGNSDYHIVGFVPKSVVMEGVQHISSMVILVFVVLAVMTLSGGFLLMGLERQSRERDALREAARVAEKSSAAKSEFLANMSHDIRTPMNAIIGFTNLALQDMTNQEQVHAHLDKIKSASSNLLGLMNDILEMSRLDSGVLELNETVCVLPQMLEELREIMDEPVREKKQTFTTDCSGVADTAVWCDRVQLHRILLNLVSNAVKFTPEGGEISLRIQESPGESPDVGRYEIRVKDNGIGMSPEFAPKAFTLFERERTSTVSGVQGSGLGLAIVKHIVDSMNGTVRVQSEPGLGSEFVVVLNLRKAEEPERTPEAQATLEEDVSLEGRRILLVDDIELNREIVAMILEMEEVETEQADDGSVAVKMIADAEPDYYDAVLMDIQMPVMDGYDATRAIRAMGGPRGATPIIALSANAFDEDKKKSAEAGMNDHLAKPVDESQLVEALRKVFAAKRQTKYSLSP